VLPSNIYHAGCYCRATGNMGIVLKFTPKNGASGVAHLQKARPFSPSDKATNDNLAPSQVHSKTFDSFPGYGKFTMSFIKQIKSFAPLPIDMALFDNVIQPAAGGSNKRKHDEKSY
jgi:hypothetical protein